VKFPPEIKTDTVIEERIQYLDSIIEIHIPGDTIHDSITTVIPCPDRDDSVVLTPGPVFSSDTLRVDGTFASAEAWIERLDHRKVQLQLQLFEHDSIMKIKLDSVIEIKDHFEHLYTVEIHKEPPDRKVHWIYKAVIAFAILELLLLFICIRYRR